LIALIDGDSLIYRAGFAIEEELDDGTFYVDLQNAKDYLDGAIDGILFQTDCDDYELWIGEREGNFRFDVAKLLQDNYKHNRKDSRKPDKFDEMYRYLKTKHKAKTPRGCEVDDVVVTKKTESPNDYVLCAIDKDVLYQTEGTHYNYGKDEFVKVTKEESIYYAYLQTLTGDTTDGYKGAFRIGPTKAVAILGVPEGNNKMIEDVLKKAKAKPEKIKMLLNGTQYNERQLWAKVLWTYRKCNQTKHEAIATMRLANMHQLTRNSKGKLELKLWEPINKGECEIDTLNFWFNRRCVYHSKYITTIPLVFYNWETLIWEYYVGSVVRLEMVIHQH